MGHGSDHPTPCVIGCNSARILNRNPKKKLFHSVWGVLGFENSNGFRSFNFSKTSRITFSVFQAEYLEGNASSWRNPFKIVLRRRYSTGFCQKKYIILFKIPAEKWICIQVSCFPHIFAGGHLVFLFIIREDNEEDLRLMKQKLLLF